MSESMSKPRVALLGLGIMGSGMAGRLLSANFPLTVYNRNPARAAGVASAGAVVAESPRQAASDADIVISMVADDLASREVWFGENGALAGVRPGSQLIESSTVSVNWVLELAAAAVQRNCKFLDAPVTGTKPHAAAGELLFLVGGSPETLAMVRPVLAVLGRDAIHLGPNGSGARLKLINNFLCGVQAASFAEAVSMVYEGGLDPEKAFAILTGGAPGSPLVKLISARATAGDSDRNFILRLMAKDISYALDEAKRLGVTLGTASSALEVFKRAIERGYGEQDFSAVINSLRRN
jgi:3-hydroxyisobutyrate dehydrogenase